MLGLRVVAEGAACKFLRLFRGLTGCGGEVEVFPTEMAQFLFFL